MVLHSFPRQLGHLNFVCLLDFWPRSLFFDLLAGVAQVEGGPGLLIFACLLEVAQVWRGLGGLFLSVWILVGKFVYWP